MKDGFDNIPVAEASTRHLGKNVPDSVQSTDNIKYKRFRRRGNRDEIHQAETVSRGAKPAAVPVTMRKCDPPLVLHEAVRIPDPATKQSDEILRWNALRPVTIGGPQIFTGTTPLVSFNRNDPASRAFDQLRTQVLQTLRSNGWSRIAIAAPTPGCGSTFTAVNLGLSFSRVPGSRILLMDLNLRAPGIAAALGVNSTGDMRNYLSGNIASSQFLVRPKDTLALGLASKQEQDASELLLHQRTAKVLNAINKDFRPDVTIYDLPPVLAFDDLVALLPQIDGVLLVADGTKTTAAQIRASECALEGRTKVLGVVLNQARTSDTQSYQDS